MEGVRPEGDRRRRGGRGRRAKAERHDGSLDEFTQAPGDTAATGQADSAVEGENSLLLYITLESPADVAFHQLLGPNLCASPATHVQERSRLHA